MRCAKVKHRKPSEEDLRKIGTEIEPKLEEIKEELEIDPETMEEIVHKSREISALSLEDMFRSLKGRANYQCNTKKDCDTCPVEPCPMYRMLIEAKPRLGRIHHPEIPMPMPSLIRKAPASKLDLEIIRRVWNGF